jgi:DNA-binding transcriptional LysR family regulator
VGVVDIGFVISMAYRFAPDLLRASAAALPELTLRLVQTRPPHMFDAVRSGQLDMAFARGPVEGVDGLVVSEVGLEKSMVVLPKGHRLAEKSAATLADLRDEPLVIPSPESLPELSAQIHTALREAGITPRIVAYSDELAAMIAYPIAGLAAGVVPEQVAAMHHPEVVYRPLAGHPPRIVSSIVAVHRPQVDPAVIRLLDLARSTRVEAGLKA